MTKFKTPKREAPKDAKDALRHWTSGQVNVVPIDSIIPWQENPRHNDGDAVRMVAHSISEFGFINPIVISSKTRQILVGNTRYKAAKFLKLGTVPAICVELSDEQERAYAIADNRSSEFAKWNEELLLLELEDLSEVIDIETIGFVEEEINEMLEEMREEIEEDNEDGAMFTIEVSVTTKTEAEALVSEFANRGYLASLK